MRTHGIKIPSETMKIDDTSLDLVSEHYRCQDSEGVDHALEIAARAVQNAKQVHLYDAQQLYRKNNVFFQTYCFNKQQDLMSKNAKDDGNGNGKDDEVPLTIRTSDDDVDDIVEVRECLVLPPIEKDGPLGLLLNYEDDSTRGHHYFSHYVKTGHDKHEHCVRLMVKIKETGTLIDPLDFRYQNGE